mmetsp:Transcript_129386/g.374696  ORF Transcript_129386/g.374696 Transcript_129386/m.374696 type:complete len:397 (+) Transcript_129386:59-1249(+)
MATTCLPRATQCFRCPEGPCEYRFKPFDRDQISSTRYPAVGNPGDDDALMEFDVTTPREKRRGRTSVDSSMGSGHWADIIPMGIRARGADGSVMVAPESIRNRLKASRTAVFDEAACRTTEPSASDTECSICCSTGDLVQAFDCQVHAFCSLCIRRHCQERLAMGMLPTCLAVCHADADPCQLQRLLEPQDWELYLVTTLRATQRYQNCPHEGCGAMVYLEEAMSLAQSPAAFVPTPSLPVPRGFWFEPGLKTSVRCPDCKKSFCVVCCQSAHPRYTCEDARRRRLAKGVTAKADDSSACYALLRAQGLDVKPCPRCGHAICKANEEDCDHMTCSRCKKEFCWSCLADREVIFHHGNHYHAPQCRFFAAYKGAPEFLPERCRQCQARGKACTPPPS